MAEKMRERGERRDETGTKAAAAYFKIKVRVTKVVGELI